MRKIVITLVIAVLGAGCEAVDVSTTEGTTTSLPSAAPTSSAEPAAPDGSLADQVASLEVADDDRDGYDRDDFADYDRDALLEASVDEHDCYYSAADDECYDDPSAYMPTTSWHWPRRGALGSPSPTPTLLPRIRTICGC